MTNRPFPDDDDRKWEYAAHTRAKHDILRYYLNTWIKKLSAPNRKLRVFDCFAGRGSYVSPGNGEPMALYNIDTDASVPGSPLIMLDVATELANLTGEIQCVFIEKEEENMEMLKDALKSVDGRPSNVTYEVECGAFEDKISPMISDTGGWGSPSFFFADPFGYSSIPYEIITDLGTQTRSEVLVNLMAKDLVQWQGDSSKDSTFATLFGTENWREELRGFTANQWDDDEVEYYCHRLREGGVRNTIAYLVTEKDSKRMKYYLVHGSGHPDALELMREAMDNCGSGEYAYAPKRADLSKSQSGLNRWMGQSREEKFQEYLMTNFEYMDITFDDIVAEVIQENEYTAYNRSDIKRLLKELRSEELIQTTQVTSKTERGLQKNDIVHF